MKMSDISILGRNTQGVRLINIKESGENVTGVAVVENTADDVVSGGEGSATEGVIH